MIADKETSFKCPSFRKVLFPLLLAAALMSVGARQDRDSQTIHHNVHPAQSTTADRVVGQLQSHFLSHHVIAVRQARQAVGG